MESTLPPSSQQPSEVAVSTGELIVHNGRQSGTRRPLAGLLTVIGRAAGCDVRLNVDGINPQHCLLVATAAGLIVRDLNSDQGTLVNGERIVSCALHDQDVLSVGPFQFQVRLPPSAGSTAEELCREKEALRIQAAAVAAQQASLAEEEIKIRQRQTALQQQEQQLAAYLEEKHRRLVQLREQTQSAQQALRHERAVYEERVGKVMREVAQARQEAQDTQRRAERERRRLIGLQRYLKQRWHRHWMAERRALRRREDDIAAGYRKLERDKERLQQEKAAQVQARLRFNGERELGRRQLRADWDELRAEQQCWQEQLTREQASLQQRQHALEGRERTLAEGEARLLDEKQRWLATRLLLEREVEGLENRIRNHRRKILDQEQEKARLENILRELHLTSPALPAPASLAVTEPGTALVPVPAAVPPIQELDQRELRLQEAEAHLQHRLAVLECLAGELADQRLQVVEYWERFYQTQQHWQREHEAVLAAVEELGQRLQVREQALKAREQALEPAENDLRGQQEELALQRQHLQGWQTRLRANEVSWEGERDRLLLEVRTREELVEQRLVILRELRQRWEKRRRQEKIQFESERGACEKLRQELAALREEWFQRNNVLEQEQRSLNEKTLALEQYKQECLAQAPDSAAAAHQVDRLRRRWCAQNAAAVRTLMEQREALQTELTQWAKLCAFVQQQVEKVSTRERELSALQTNWEQEQTRSLDQQARLEQELQSLRLQRCRQEQQLTELNEELERVARLLLEEGNVPTLSVVQAA
jgi:pSer/pThr/pTyr-binding forkhead associated (FHA) protein